MQPFASAAAGATIAVSAAVAISIGRMVMELLLLRTHPTMPTSPAPHHERDLSFDRPAACQKQDSPLLALPLSRSLEKPPGRPVRAAVSGEKRRPLAGNTGDENAQAQD